MTNVEAPQGAGLRRRLLDGSRAFEGLLERRPGPVLLALLGVAFALRLVAVAAFGTIDPASANLWEYGDLARNYLQHGEMSLVEEVNGQRFVFPSAFMPPGMTWLWIALFRLFGVTPAALAAMLAINILAATWIVWLTWKIGLATAGSRLAAFIAAAIVAFYPTFVYSAATYHAHNIYIATVLWALYCTMQLREKPTWDGAFRVGLAWGISALMRSEFILFGIVFIGLAALRLPSKRHAILAVAVFAAALVPWGVRNYEVFGRVILTAQSLGYNLWKGFNPAANGSGDYSIAHALPPPALAGVAAGRDYEMRTDKVYLDAALAYMREEPVRSFVDLPIRKNLLFWGLEIYDDQGMTFWPSYLVPHVVTSLLALVGIWLVVRQRDSRRRFALVFWFFLLQALVIAVFGAHTRYRMTVEPLLFVFTAIALVAWVRGESWRSDARAGQSARAAA